MKKISHHWKALWVLVHFICLLWFSVSLSVNQRDGDWREYLGGSDGDHWVFRTIPHPGEQRHNTWPEDAYKNPAIGGANSWAGMAIDHHRGLVFVPTGWA